MTSNPLNCQTVQDWITTLVSGELSDEQRCAMDAHLASCQACAELLSRYLLTDTESENGSDGQQVDMILARTSGPACSSAHNLIFTDDIEADDRTLLNEHAAHCVSCNELLETWEWVNPTLETMALLEPGSEFVDLVLDKTSGKPMTVPLGHRIREWWKGVGDLIVTRPRFAMEFSYVTTLILVLVFGPLNAPMQMVRDHEPIMSKAGVVTSMFDTGIDSVMTTAGSSWTRGSQWTDNKIDAIVTGYHRMTDRVSPSIEDMKKHGQALKDSIKKRDINRAVPALHGIWVNCRSAWNAFRADPVEGDTHGKSNHTSE